MATTFTNLLYHLVFSTKDRQLLLTPELLVEVCGYMGGIVREHDGVLLDAGGMADHVHLVIKLKPDVSISELMRLVKANSSKWINERPGAQPRFEWQAGYGAFSVSESQLAVVRNYVRHQEEHHRRRSFQEEFLEMLRRHGISFDERYVWG
jgi:putative transposase